MHVQQVLMGALALVGAAAGQTDSCTLVTAEAGGMAHHCNQAVVLVGEEREEMRLTSGAYHVSHGGVLQATAADVDAAINWHYVDLSTDNPRIDWSGESHACKAAYLALACAFEFYPCQDTTCGTACNHKENQYGTHLFLKNRVNDACTQQLWTKPYPDRPENATTFDVIMPADACMPDGSSATPGAACKAAYGESCGEHADCFSHMCMDMECDALANGDTGCFNEDSCLSGVCNLEYRTCEGLAADAACVLDGQCVSKSCVDNKCAAGGESSHGSHDSDHSDHDHSEDNENGVATHAAFTALVGASLLALI